MAEAVTLENWVFDPDTNYGTNVITGPGVTLEQAKRQALEEMSHIPESHRHNMEYFAIPHKGETCVAARYCGNPHLRIKGLPEGGFWWTPEDV